MKTTALFSIALLPLAATAAETVTARQIIERIQKNVGVAWRAQTVDTFKSGDPDTPVTGIATTFIASMDVLRRAAASGRNLIITHEPTFYNHLDQTADLKDDAVLAAKQAFIENHRLVIWRFHDHWHMRRPDGIIEGMTRALGWEKYRKGPLFVLPETTVSKLAADIRARLKIRTLRVVGNPEMRFTRVAFLPGAPGALSQIRALARDEVEVAVAGETTEWQAAEYARDAAGQGKRKALILLGHVVSEEAGMEECARWIKTFVPEVPIEFLPAGEPFWTAR